MDFMGGPAFFKEGDEGVEALLFEIGWEGGVGEESDLGVFGFCVVCYSWGVLEGAYPDLWWREGVSGLIW